ncbi:hypothetical protein BHE74_00051757 [Ensete ventricosum]|nr:hypothetical protein GW17_00057376 [Ensete ventricosum]RWW42671.1 hypothetical protein BHE74_00051757 [Ensete ventricosum]
MHVVLLPKRCCDEETKQGVSDQIPSPSHIRSHPPSQYGAVVLRRVGRCLRSRRVPGVSFCSLTNVSPISTRICP